MTDLANKDRNPFPGLRPFRPDEEYLFFGRERQVDRMIAKLATQRFLAVVGTSGSGKSSLVNCGLRPALHRGYMASAGSTWRMAQFRPGGDPIGALARALAQRGVLFDGPLEGALTAEDLVESTLRLGSRGLVLMVERADLPAGTQLLVVVDQFEELFRHRSARDAEAFVRLLLEAAAQATLPIHVVLTMRSDFLGDCAQFYGLPEAINEGQYLVPRLTREQIRAAITGPADVEGQTINPLLVTRLLNDVGDNPDQLSTLQHALNRTWAHWANEGAGQGEIDLPHYLDMGAMADALNRHAEKAYGELPDDGARRLCERVFKALTDTGTDARGVRRMTRLAALAEITGAQPAALEAVLKPFRKPSRSFLMPPDGETLGPDADIDISHESLMRLWKRLRAWADEEVQSARTFRELRDKALKKASLWRDPELGLARAWHARNQPTPAWAEMYGGDHKAAMKFLDDSRQAQDAERLEAEVERRWQSGWNYLPLALVAVPFMVAQIYLSHDSEAGKGSLFDFLMWAQSPATARQAPAQRAVLKENQAPPQDRVLPEGPLLPENKALPVNPAPPENEAVSESEALKENRGQKKSRAQLFAAAASHLVAGIPAVLGYIVIVPPIRRRFHAKAVADIQREAAAALAPPEATSAAAAVLNPLTTARAGFWRRAGASAVDWAITLPPATALLFFLDKLSEFMLHQERYVAFWLMLTLLLWVLGIGGYHVLLWSSRRQATPGMRLLGIVITDLKGRPIGPLRGSMRFLARFLSYYTLGVGFFMQPFTAQRQALHDRMAGTLVLRRPPPPAAGDYRNVAPTASTAARVALATSSRKAFRSGEGVTSGTGAARS